jgi:dTDP-4-amino-4,6-dideoxygalactose transaminase
MNKKTIPMLDLKAEYQYMKTDIDAAIGRCLEHQQWILGPEVKEFEDRVAEYIDVKHCIGVSSGTDALVLALRAFAIKTTKKEYFDRSDFIITTPFTFTATGDAILRAGATPLFIDIDPITYNINPRLIRSCLERFSHSLSTTAHSLSPRVVGILPVHLYGQSCQMDEIMAISREFDLLVIEDVAQAFGALWNDKKLGSIGTAGAFSFFPSKNLGGFGDGGMISTNDDEIAGLIRILLKHGGKDKYNVDYIGYNARLDALQAAILLAKLNYIDELNNLRSHVASLYTEMLAKSNDIILPINQSLPEKHIYHQYTIRVLNYKRNWLQSLLKKKGIDSMAYYPVPLHKMKVFQGRCEVYGELIEAERAAETVLSLPIEPLMKSSETIRIAEEVIKSLREK